MNKYIAHADRLVSEHVKILILYPNKIYVGQQRRKKDVFKKGI